MVKSFFYIIVTIMLFSAALPAGAAGVPAVELQSDESVEVEFYVCFYYQPSRGSSYLEFPNVALLYKKNAAGSYVSVGGMSSGVLTLPDGYVVFGASYQDTFSGTTYNIGVDFTVDAVSNSGAPSGMSVPQTCSVTNVTVVSANVSVANLGSSEGTLSEVVGKSAYYKVTLKVPNAETYQSLIDGTYGDDSDDTDGDGIPDDEDPDDDNDGIPDSQDADADGDGQVDSGKTDANGNGIDDASETLGNNGGGGDDGGSDGSGGDSSNGDDDDNPSSTCECGACCSCKCTCGQWFPGGVSCTGYCSHVCPIEKNGGTHATGTSACCECHHEGDDEEDDEEESDIEFPDITLVIKDKTGISKPGSLTNPGGLNPPPIQVPSLRELPAFQFPVLDGGGILDWDKQFEAEVVPFEKNPLPTDNSQYKNDDFEGYERENEEGEEEDLAELRYFERTGDFTARIDFKRLTDDVLEKFGTKLPVNFVQNVYDLTQSGVSAASLAPLRFGFHFTLFEGTPYAVPVHTPEFDLGMYFNQARTLPFVPWIRMLLLALVCLYFVLNMFEMVFKM